jgi:hypothetical protein
VARRTRSVHAAGSQPRRVLTAAEFTANDDDDREDRFGDLDANNDGRVSRAEWHGSAAVFSALDANGDGVLVREEAIGTGTGR